jgi:uncharacterized repeat protein (TIGR03803 family)
MATRRAQLYAASLVNLLALVAATAAIANPVHASAASESVLWNFGNGTDGNVPQAALLEDASGALYGTTGGGGKYDLGTVFKLTPSKKVYTERTLWSFGRFGDGRKPAAGLIADASGGLYGTTSLGGTSERCVASSIVYGCGTVFKLTPKGSGYTESVLWRFYVAATDGKSPAAALLADSNGALYGTTVVGGTHNHGTVFKLTPSSQGYTESVIWNFGKGKDGQSQFAALIMDAAGAFYGTTFSGGTQTCPGTTTIAGRYSS